MPGVFIDLFGYFEKRTCGVRAKFRRVHGLYLRGRSAETAVLRGAQAIAQGYFSRGYPVYKEVRSAVANFFVEGNGVPIPTA